MSNDIEINFDLEVEGTSPAADFTDDVGFPPTASEVDDAHYASSPHGMLLTNGIGVFGASRVQMGSASTKTYLRVRMYISSTSVYNTIILQKTTGVYVPANTIIHFAGYTDGTIRYYDGAWKTTGQAYTTGWHTFEVEIDYGAETYDIYYDGSLVKADTPFRSSGSSAWSLHLLRGVVTGNNWYDDIILGDPGWYGNFNGSTNPARVISTVASMTADAVKDTNNPVNPLGGVGKPDAVTLGKSSIIFDEGLYKMWYSGADGAIVFSICYATSPDGITWTKHGTAVLEKTGAGWESVFVYYPSVIKVGSTYHMWYSGWDGTNIRIGYASSSDGITWVRGSNNPVIDLGSDPSWDDTYVYSPSVILDGSTYKMWYTGSSDGSDAKIGYTTSTDPDDNWSKDGGNPCLSGVPGWENSRVSNCDVKKHNEIYRMAYSGDAVNNGKVGWAEGADGIAWTKEPGNPIIDHGAAALWDDTGCYAPGIIYSIFLDRFFIFYSGQGTASHPKEIGLGYYEICYINKVNGVN